MNVPEDGWNTRLFINVLGSALDFCTQPLLCNNYSCTKLTKYIDLCYANLRKYQQYKYVISDISYQYLVLRKKSHRIIKDKLIAHL